MAHLGIKKANENQKATHILSYSIIYVVHTNFIFSPFLSASLFPFWISQDYAQSPSKISVLLTQVETLLGDQF